MESDRCSYCARRNIMRSAERREEVVEGLFIRNIDNRQPGAHLVPVAVKNVVMPHRQVKQVTRLNPLRIVIVFFRPGFRYLEVYGSEGCVATFDWGLMGSREWAERQSIARAQAANSKSLLMN